MPYRRQQFANGEIYHLMIRSIDDNLLFKDVDDYYRGIFSIYEFNNSNPVSIFRRRKAISAFKKSLKEQGIQSPSLSGSLMMPDDRDLMVEIFAFCFMPNHIHLLVRQIKNGGIEKFMRKIGTGYAKYFNKKYDRKGYVFQNRFVSVPVKNDGQLKTVFAYIHTNPISLIEPHWKEIGIKDQNEVIKFLENYKWSSYLDYIGKQNFFSVTQRDFISGVIGGEQGCRSCVEDWVRYKEEIMGFSDLALE